MADLVEDKSKISDGYHTFSELYEHRHALFIALANAYPNQAWRSLLHSDGTMYEGDWFIAGMNLESGQISYHLPLSYWPYLQNICTLENAPKWDGHKPEDVVNRLMKENG